MIVEWPAWDDHSTILEWFDGRTTRRSSSGSMVGPLDDHRVACLGRPLDDRRVACSCSDHSTIVEQSVSLAGCSEHVFR
ncbi:hypothetical protein F2Q70_00003854 [Brassica cretica]|uniref:Uncharacterized protein n=1 Tax=Brassica cretica TaxID=69181 RepID=A0A8S9J0Y9_BRACR|nr:hypothetical protein F2Q70_00003854 [Brassica cretica]